MRSKRMPAGLAEGRHFSLRPDLRQQADRKLRQAECFWNVCMGAVHPNEGLAGSEVREPFGLPATPKEHPMQRQLSSTSMAVVPLLGAAALLSACASMQAPSSSSFAQTGLPPQVQVPGGHKVAMETVGVGEIGRAHV